MDKEKQKSINFNSKQTLEYHISILGTCKKKIKNNNSSDLFLWKTDKLKKINVFDLYYKSDTSIFVNSFIFYKKDQREYLN